jgi:UDP-N-acetylglucosamine transferase subunit ALG13
VIFVTIGNAIQPFQRLLSAVDDLAGRGIWRGERVLLQTGYSKAFSPRHCEAVPFLPMVDFHLAMEEANVIVSHGGCGTLLNAVRLGKRPVAMPRLKKYGEHINDHQLQLVAALVSEGKVIPAYEPGDLEEAIAKSRSHSIHRTSAEPTAMLYLVSEAIRELAGNSL